MNAIKELPQDVKNKVLTWLFFGALVLFLLALYGVHLANPVESFVYLPGENWFYDVPSSGDIV